MHPRLQEMQSSVALQHGCAAGSCAQPVLGLGSWPCPAGAHSMASSTVFCHCAGGCWANEVGRQMSQSTSCVLRQEATQSERSEAAFPLLLMLGILFRPLPWLLYFLLFHGLFMLEISPTNTRYFCPSREDLSHPLQSQPCCAYETFHSLRVCANCWDLFGLIA